MSHLKSTSRPNSSYPRLPAGTLSLSQTPLQGKLRHQTLAGIASPNQYAGPTAFHIKAVTTSQTLIRELEDKIRKIVETKRSESDRLTFEVAKIRHEVDKGKNTINDLVKESIALGITPIYVDMDNKCIKNIAHDIVIDDSADLQIDNDEKNRLQPIVAISRRPVYAKNTNISDTQNKLERRMKQVSLVHRKSLVFDHMKKRLLEKRMELIQETNRLKEEYDSNNHRVPDYHKQEIIANEAVSHAEVRLAQEKERLANLLRDQKDEANLQKKWEREKSKFDRYYKNQLRAAELRASSAEALQGEGIDNSSVNIQQHFSTNSRYLSRRLSAMDHKALGNNSEENHNNQQTEDKLLSLIHRFGVPLENNQVDPEEIASIIFSHQRLKLELDETYDHDLERHYELKMKLEEKQQELLEQAPVSKREGIELIEGKELESKIACYELKNSVNQYEFINQSVQPIKSGLQYLLQTITNEHTDCNDLSKLETCLVSACEKLVQAANELDFTSVDIHAINDIKNPLGIYRINTHCDSTTNFQVNSPQNCVEDKALLAPAKILTSPHNIRISAKNAPDYFVPGIHFNNPIAEDDNIDDHAVDIMDRATVKRISSILIATSSGKRKKKIDNRYNCLHKSV